MMVPINPIASSDFGMASLLTPASPLGRVDYQLDEVVVRDERSCRSVGDVFTDREPYDASGPELTDSQRRGSSRTTQCQELDGWSLSKRKEVYRYPACLERRHKELR